jgi:hypothetical protein
MSGPLARSFSAHLGGVRPSTTGASGILAGALVQPGPDGIPPAGLRAFRVLDAAPAFGAHAGTLCTRRDGADGWLGMPPSGGPHVDDWFPLGLMRHLQLLATAYAAGWREWFALEGLGAWDWYAIAAAGEQIFVADYSTAGIRMIRRSSAVGVAPWEDLVNSPDVPYTAMCFQPDGAGAGLYAAAIGGDIYYCADPFAVAPVFVALGEGPRQWMGLAAAPNGDVYATVLTGDIYVRVAGAGAFVSAGATAQLGNQYWRGIYVDPGNGDVWVVTADAGIPSKIYLRIAGAGLWTVFASFNTGQDLFGVAVINGDAYFSSSNGPIWVARGGAFPAVAAEARPANWRHLTVANGILHAIDAANGLVLRRS